MEDEKELDCDSLDCAVCLQKCHHPAQLPCGHVFCFLCVKGIAIQNKKCAMCRTIIPPDFLEKPVLLKNIISNTGSTEENTSDNYQWYYEGSNGWWKYDERSNSELELAWNSSATDCVLLLAGALYRIDFQTMIQTRRNDPTRRRRVKRDTPTLPAKGIAGIKILENEDNHQSKSSPLGDATPEQLVDTGNYVTSDSQVSLTEEPSHDEADIVDLFRRVAVEDINADATQITDNMQNT